MFKNLFSRKLEQKAISTDQNLINIISNEPYNKDKYSAQELIKLNKNWIYICNFKNASTCASVPLKLYYNSNGKSIEKTPHRKIDKKTFNILRKELNKKTLELDDIVEIIEHPVLDLLYKINDSMNYIDFVQLVQGYCGLIGNSYVRIELTNGVPSALYPLLSEYVSVICDKATRQVTKYIYKVNNDTVTYQPDEILHFVNYCPGDITIGRGDLEACVDAAMRYNYYDAYENYLNRNNARPDFIINYKNNINEKDYKEVYRQFTKRFGSVKNAGKPIVTTGEMNIQNIGLAPRELQYSLGRAEAQKVICAVFGVPEALVELNSANLASSLSANNMYNKYTIYPKMTALVEKLNEKLLPMYDSNLFLWFDKSFENSQIEQAEVDQIYITNGVYNGEYVRNRDNFMVDMDDETVNQPVKPVQPVEPNKETQFEKPIQA